MTKIKQVNMTDHEFVDYLRSRLDALVMTGKQLEQHLIELGFSQAQFGRLLGVTPIAVYYWIVGKRPIQDRTVRVVVPSYAIFAIRAMRASHKVHNLAVRMSKTK